MKEKSLEKSLLFVADQLSNSLEFYKDENNFGQFVGETTCFSKEDGINVHKKFIELDFFGREELIFNLELFKGWILNIVE